MKLPALLTGTHRRIKKFFGHPFWRNRFAVFMLLNGVLANILLWLYLNFSMRPSSALFPLHYTVYGGVDVIDRFSKLFTLPLFGLMSLLLNTIVAQAFWEEHPAISRFLMVNTLLIHIVLGVALYFIFQLIGGEVYG